MEPSKSISSSNPNLYTIPSANITNDPVDSSSSLNLKSCSSFSTQTNLLTLDENKLSFSCATKSFEKMFQNENAIWIHGKSERLRNVICEKYIEEHLDQYQGNIHWINADESSNAFIGQLRDLGLKLQPKWKNAFPENYPQAFESHFQGKPYLIIFSGATINHWASIVEFLKEGRGDHHHFFISSQKLLNEKSVVIVSDDKYQEISIENIKTKNPLLIDSLRKLSFLDYQSLEQNVLKMVCPDLKFEDLKNLGLVRGSVDSFSIHQDVIGSFNSEILDSTFDQLVELFRKILDFPLKSTAQEWAIPHVLALFERYNKGFSKLQDSEKKQKKDLLVVLGSMVLDIGHFYTQHGKPLLAQEVTCMLKDKLDSKKNVNLVELKKIHEHLPYLYLNTVYQLGRIYFYCKNPDERLGSLALLTHAKNLCEKILENGKKPLLSILIDRNGLLPHLKEEKQFEKAVAGYKKLLNESDSIYFSVDFKAGKLATESYKDDYQHQATCLKYMIDACMELHKGSTQEELDNSIGKEVAILQDVIPNLSRHNQVDSWIYLSKFYLKQNMIDTCLSRLSEVFLEAKSNQKLAILEIKISCYKKIGKCEEADKCETEYNKIAEDYYPTGHKVSENILLKAPVVKPIPEKKDVPVPVRIVIEMIQGDKIILDAGEGRKLTLAKPLADFIKKQGEWEALKETLKSSEDPGKSRFMTSQGYRLSLDQPLTSLGSMGGKMPKVSDLCEIDGSWSDDDLDEDGLQASSKHFIDDEQSLLVKNKHLHNPESSYPKLLSESIASKKGLQEKADEIKKAATSKLEAEVNFNHHVSQLTESFVKKMKQDSTNLREYVETYIRNKNTTAKTYEEQIEPKGILKLKKIEQELNYLKEREAYLKLKQEKLIKKRVKILTQKKIERFSDSPENIEELRISLQMAEQLPLVKQAHPIEITSDKIQEHRKNSDLLHFSCPHAFIYHTLKHQSPPPFTIGPKGPVFSLGKFEQNAVNYLGKTREIVGKEAKIVCSIPDQFSASRTNFRYLKFPISSEEMKRLLFLEREIQKNKQIIEKLDREESNNKLLWKEKVHEEEIKRINEKKRSPHTKKGELENEYRSLYNKFGEEIEIKCDFVSLAVEKDDNNLTTAYFLTQFSTDIFLNKLPVAEIVPLGDS